MRETAFYLPPAMRDEIFAHAREEAPRECCGVISTRDGVPVALYRMTNTYPGVDFYEPSGKELYARYTEIEEAGLELGAIYHSHPVSPAYPSSRDVEFAGWPTAIYLICSLQHPEAPVIRAFTIADEMITEHDIVDG